MKRRVAGFLAFLMFLLSCIPTYAAGSTYSECWRETAEKTWYVVDTKGNMIKNAWFCDDAVQANGKDVWYVIGSDGAMVTGGLIQDRTGNYYSLETSGNGYFGMMRNKSGIYDGIELQIQTEHNGNFGAILNADGIAALKAKYGLTVVDIDNTNIVYSSQIVAKKAVSSYSGGSEEKGDDEDVETEHTVSTPFAEGTKKLGYATLAVSGKTITYKNSSDTPQKLTITTAADETLIIDAPLDDITHEGTAKEVKILQAADNSYVGNAEITGALTVESGHVVLNADAANLTVEATAAVSVDVSENVSVGGTVEVSKQNDNGEMITFNIDGSVDAIESSTGDIALTVGIDTKAPRLQFVGEEAVKAYKKRCEERLGKETIIANIKCGDEVITHETTGEETRRFMCFGQTFEDDVYVNGDFTNIIFAGCTFKGDIINRGSEMCMVMLADCDIASSSVCRFENNGRQLLSINDLISKFVWVESVNEDVNVVCGDGANGAVIATGTTDPVLFNGAEYSFEDMEYYCDESDEGSGEIEAYEGQPVNLLYVGKMSMTDGTKPLIILGELDQDSGPALYPPEK